MVYASLMRLENYSADFDSRIFPWSRVSVRYQPHF